MVNNTVVKIKQFFLVNNTVVELKHFLVEI